MSALQLELLNIYSFQPKEEDLVAIKTILAKYFSIKLQKNIRKAIEGRNITEKYLDRLLNE
jgi:hypothetical protein